MNNGLLKVVALLLLLPVPADAETGVTAKANRGDKISLSYLEPMTGTHSIATLRRDGLLEFTVSMALNESDDFNLLSSHSTQLSSDKFETILRMVDQAQFALMPTVLKPLAGKDCWSDPIRMKVSLSRDGTARTVSYWQSCSGPLGQPRFEGLVRAIDMELQFSGWLDRDRTARSAETNSDTD